MIKGSCGLLRNKVHSCGDDADWAGTGKPRSGVRQLCLLLAFFVGTPILLCGLPSGVHLNELSADNSSSNLFRDEDGEVEDWIEIYNGGTSTVSLGGWSLTDDPGQPQKWIFPEISIGAGQYLVVFASDKDRKPTAPGANLHTNFKLKGDGEYLGLYSVPASQSAISELAPSYPAQKNDVSYGMDDSGNWVYFQNPTPGGPNGDSAITDAVAQVQFNFKSGLFDSPFLLELSTGTSGAIVVYTIDGSRPTENHGDVYTDALPIKHTTIIRAAAFKSNALPSPVRSRSYLFNTDSAMQSLPIISIVMSPDDLVGPTGIMGISGGTYVLVDESFSEWRRVNPADYFNPSETGMAWERRASVELLERQGQKGFKIESGIRVHGSESSRRTFRSDSKVPYGLFFRGDYGEGRLNYPLVPGSRVESYDSLVLRAGHNDAINPFITDELMRRLFADTGHASSLGTFVNVFLNGKYQGYYNAVERIEEDWAQSWFGGINDWDVIAPYSEAVEGDIVEWSAMLQYAKSHDPDRASFYEEMSRRLDMVNFIDYLLVNIYGDTHDWTENNWRAVRERISESKFRFVLWDAELALGLYGYPVTANTFNNREALANSSEIATLYKKLKANREFRLLFADRIQKHFFNGGALMDANILARFETLRQVVSGVIPIMADHIPNYWVPQRREIVLEDLANAGLRSTVVAPAFNQNGGDVPVGFNLEMSAPAGRIYYTLNGIDPRIMFSGKVASDAQLYTSGVPVPLRNNVLVKARALSGTTWSALTEAQLQVADSDGDGMPDAWERNHGLDPQKASDAALDADSDGASSLEEYRVGTDPRDRESSLRIESIHATRQAVSIRFTAAAWRSYSVIYQNIGESSAWSKLDDVDGTLITRSIELKDSISRSSTARFYRVVTPALR